MRACPRLVAIAAAVVLASGAAVAGGGSAAAAGSEDVGSAREQVAAMRAKVAEVAADLERGTRAYESGQAHLAKVVRQQAAVQRQVRDLAAASAGEQKRLDQIASAAYRHPLPDTVGMLMTRSGGDLPGALVSKADLEHVSGSQQDTLRTVVAARVRAQALARSAEQLAADARATSNRLTRQLTRLRATADRANAQLQAAAVRLERAQGVEQARLAAERASRARRAASAGGAACQGRSTSGYPNGFLPASALCPLWQAPGERLRADAAAAFNRMSQAHAASAGGPLCVTDSYRSYAGQVAVYREKPSLAATPGTSEHGWGLAVDLCGGVQQFGSDAYRWMQANAGGFGFGHPAWAEPSGSKPEPWHWEFAG
ncbi:MAG: D-alanyl-D-alanine carboxypeptidase family protein [Actinobacteria bacterium]|nr:D-alanyl-D-alanine carboxypeptidase family protein [Actinomycetota bacterium]MCA1721951.1 D-alanyl-D-alanine carboxypeptidase family protein [Actinomycetota bacterium]